MRGLYTGDESGGALVDTPPVGQAEGLGQKRKEQEAVLLPGARCAGRALY